MIRTEAQRARKKRQRDKRKQRQKANRQSKKLMNGENNLTGFRAASSYQAWARRNDYDDKKEN